MKYRFIQSYYDHKRMPKTDRYVLQVCIALLIVYFIIQIIGV